MSQDLTTGRYESGTKTDNKMKMLSMTKHNILAIMMFGLLMSQLAACSSGEREIIRKDTVTIAPDPTPPMPEHAISDVAISPRGVGPIRTGMRISEIKPSVENLYDTIVRESGYDSNSYYFILDGETRFSVYEFESGIVNVVAADNPTVVVNGPDGCRLRIGDSFNRIVEIKDSNAVWQSVDGDGMWCWNWQGLWFVPEQDKLDDRLAHKLYNQTCSPQRSDFPDDVKIGYIGTGLPW